MNWHCFLVMGLILNGLTSPLAGGVAGRAKAPLTFDQHIVPLLNEYCFGCHGNGKHKGDLALDTWSNEASAREDRKTWEKILQKIQAGEMPPEDERQPGSKERRQLVSWIEGTVLNCDCNRPDPGRVTVRRLNRAEYNNTVFDLLGVAFRPADDFPVDDSGYGFDNIGDALSTPGVLLEKYLAASERILDAALEPHGAVGSRTNRYPVDVLELGYNAKQRGDGWVALNSIEEDDVAVNFPVTQAGEYVIRVRAYARQDSTNSIKLTFMLGKQPVKIVPVETNQLAPRYYEASLTVPIGQQRFRAVVRRVKDGMPESEALKWKSGPHQKGAVFVEHLEIEGPLDLKPPRPPETHRRIFFRQPGAGDERQTAREILDRFARRAYRRPVSENELTRLVDLAETARKRCGHHEGESHCFEKGIRTALQAILVSPHFLFRGELQPEPDNPNAIHLVNEYALASRLSYFLWSSMPDDELFNLAGQGKLRRNLEPQVRRMLKDPKSRALVDNFAGQWLQLRNVDLMTPDPKTFAGFDEPLRAAMRRETELFFEHILREDRSVLEFLTADYTFVNRRLARHYGMTNDSRWPSLWNKNGSAGHVPASHAMAASEPVDPFVRVSLRRTPRRGVLTHGSILLITSNPTRTSPVKRGKWVLDNLLNAPPPPPPPNVPELKERKDFPGTLRQRLERHRTDAVCAACHARMDPIGFGLENFDGIGAWRTLDDDAPVDSKGKLASGETFTGAEELALLLAKEKRDQFVRCLADKMLTYGLGRGLEYFDKCALDEIGRNLPRRGYRFSALVMEIVKSAPFQMRRGDDGKRSP
jgi:hypothetical protein